MVNDLNNDRAETLRTIAISIEKERNTLKEKSIVMANLYDFLLSFIENKKILKIWYMKR